MKHLANAATVLDYDWSVPATQHRWGLKQPGVKYTKEIPREEKGRIAPAQHVEFRRPNARVSDHANDAVGNVQTNAYTASLHSPLGPESSFSQTPSIQDGPPSSMRTSPMSQAFPLVEAGSSSSPLDWLATNYLPNPSRIAMLVEEYFNNIHPLRAFAFIHKPSFLQRLDGETSKEYHNHALLHVICALGAHETTTSLEPKFVLLAGTQWAKIAQRLILETIDRVTIESLMAAVLLHDYAVRLGNFANAFMLSGLTTRMTQALQINLEYNTDILCQDTENGLPVTAKESRRRLMWSCYIMDALVGSGVDQLTLMDERDIKIQLPCNERNFTQNVPCITETLYPGSWLKILPEDSDTKTLLPNMGIMAYFIRHISIRKRVLRYIKHLGDAMVPWDPASEFSLLDSDCRAWYESLPASLQFTPDAMYIRKDTSQLGALCLLHCAHYQTVCDLYRLGAPALYKLRAAFDFPPEQRDFLRHLQQVLFDAARALATIIGQAAGHGPRMLADSWLPTIAYDSCRIMVYHLTQILDPRSDNAKALALATIPLLRSNINALKLMGSLNAIASSLSSAAETMLDRSGIESELVSQNIIPDDPYQSTEEEDTSDNLRETPVQSAPDYVLNPLTIYRMARKSIPERHAPERAGTTSALRGNNAGDIDYPPCEVVSGSGVESGQAELEVDQSSLEELQTLFMSDLGWAWQPADTAVGSGTEGAGLLPWAGGYPITQTQPWLPVFPFPQQS
ncbi:Transcription factor, fungi [Penicillium expansum]|nr:Transcription factor, fungi [Penicillium expansum]KGO44317.1 Transcription factor, fungi [Penicillium expansum]